MTPDNPYKEFMDNLTKDPVKLKKFLRDVMGPPSRTLEGQEKENVWLMILMQDKPTSFSNNQHTITEVYHINQKEYHLTQFATGDYVIDEMLPDD